MFISFKASFIAFGVSLSLLFVGPLAADTVTPEKDVREGYRKHAALTQLHRWYQFYENDGVPIENQLDILDKDVRLSSSLGEGVGHEVYRQRVAKLPVSWQNAHKVKSAEPRIDEDGTISINFEIDYQNVGMIEGVVRTARLAYTTTLAPTDKLLPSFTLIKIEQISDGVADAFKDEYPDNRLRSLMHYWLAIIEDPKRDPEPARELLADRFSLNFTSGAITEFDGFRAWLAGPGSQIAASTHVPDNFSYEKVEDDKYRLKVDFVWQGILPDGKRMTAKTRHSWDVVDNPKDRFAKIETMNVEILQPFAVAKD
ncbi:MAG: hypothetical protein AAFW74_06420 [Pseudomonadota bacterium]